MCGSPGFTLGCRSCNSTSDFTVGSTSDSHPHGSTGIPCSSGFTLVRRRFTCATDFRAFGCASSLHPLRLRQTLPFLWLRLGPRSHWSCVNSPPILWPPDPTCRLVMSLPQLCLGLQISQLHHWRFASSYHRLLPGSSHHLIQPISIFCLL